jgi:large subunit ribosomal protein L18
MRTEKKQQLARLRHWRVRHKVCGTKERPRMSVCFTNKNIHVQFIDDDAGVTLAAVSTTSKAVPDRDKLGANAVGAGIVGKLAAETVVFDRGGARYHHRESKGKDGKRVLILGKLATLAEAARATGLKF